MNTASTLEYLLDLPRTTFLPDQFNPVYDSDSFSFVDVPVFVPRSRDFDDLQPRGTEEISILQNSGPQQSTMGWNRQNIPKHYLLLRYALASFRHHLLTTLPHCSNLHGVYQPNRRLRSYAESSWQQAVTYFAGRHDMVLETHWIDASGNWRQIDQDKLFETVRLRTSLRAKSSSSRI